MGVIVFRAWIINLLNYKLGGLPLNHPFRNSQFTY